MGRSAAVASAAKHSAFTPAELLYRRRERGCKRSQPRLVIVFMMLARLCCCFFVCGWLAEARRGVFRRPARRRVQPDGTRLFAASKFEVANCLVPYGHFALTVEDAAVIAS